MDLFTQVWKKGLHKKSEHNHPQDFLPFFRFFLLSMLKHVGWGGPRCDVITSYCDVIVRLKRRLGAIQSFKQCPEAIFDPFEAYDVIG